VLLIALLLPHVSCAGTRAVLSVVDFSPYAYACEISDYGDSLVEDMFYRAILMKPPGDPQLCEFPPLLASEDFNLTLPIQLKSPLGLLVSLGGCDVYQKTEIALQMYERASRSLRFIVFYNNDDDDTDGIVSILPPEEGSGIRVPDNIKKLAFLSISTSAGVNLMGLVQKYSDATRKSPEFLREGENGWDLAMIVERLITTDWFPPPRDPYDNNNTNTGINGGNFYWFRLILFALLIISPCCRGAYLWWNGGGRIHFRRNEDGRIVGLQYVSPISYWFASNGVQDAGVPISNRLTEEQVLGLPEIAYKHQEEDEAPNDRCEDDEVVNVAQIDDVDIVVSSGSADENETKKEVALNRAASISESVRSDEEQVMEENLTTRCTTCSICIDEFEPDERIRLLPRCHHAFHTECIMPWLTERQGCCPLCKKSVIEPEGGDDAGQDTTTDVEPTLSQDENGTEQDSISAAISQEDQNPSTPTENSDSVVHLSNSDGASSDGLVVRSEAVSEDNGMAGEGRTSALIQQREEEGT
jgi:hypothetical protein